MYLGELSCNVLLGNNNLNMFYAFFFINHSLLLSCSTRQNIDKEFKSAYFLMAGRTFTFVVVIMFVCVYVTMWLLFGADEWMDGKTASNLLVCWSTQTYE